MRTAVKVEDDDMDIDTSPVSHLVKHREFGATFQAGQFQSRAG